MRPRGMEQTSFEQLRNLAALYDGIQICTHALQRMLCADEPAVLCDLPAVGQHDAEGRQEGGARLDSRDRLLDEIHDQAARRDDEAQGLGALCGRAAVPVLALAGEGIRG